MNLKALKIFASIMIHGTLAKAADEQCLSVSAASRQLSVLEAELGMPLFTREQRNLRPTAEGQMFYEEAQRILYGLNELPEIAEKIRQEAKSSFRLIAVPRLVRHIVSPAVAKMCQNHPDIKMHVDIQAMRYIQRWVAGFQFHLGLGRLPAEHPEISTRVFCSLPVVVALHPKHRLAHRSELTLEDLDGEPMVGLMKETLLGLNMHNIYHSLGRLQKPVVEVSNSYHACGIVASGFGYTIGGPLSPHSLGEGQLALVPLKTDFRFEYAFFEPKNAYLSENAQIFEKYVQEEADLYRVLHGF